MSKKKARCSDLKVVCRDCDMTAGEVEERMAEIRRTNPDYTENDFWCDHERDSCPGGA